jgi:predicted PolB exonuclease-like 3'-5' exonuclease
MPIGLDIETMPNSAMIDCLPEPELPEMPGNYKKQETIDKWMSEQPQRLAAAKEKMVADMALSPYYGRIVSIATHNGLGGRYDVIHEESDADEIIVIETCLHWFTSARQGEPSIITWNGFSFDIPFIFKRAMMLKMDLSKYPGIAKLKDMTRRYTHIPHCDMSMELSSWENKFSSLDNAAKVILGERKIEYDFRQFPQMIKDGRQDEIGVYNLRDAELTIRIYNASKDYIF